MRAGRSTALSSSKRPIWALVVEVRTHISVATEAHVRPEVGRGCRTLPRPRGPHARRLSANSVSCWVAAGCRCRGIEFAFSCSRGTV